MKKSTRIKLLKKRLNFLDKMITIYSPLDNIRTKELESEKKELEKKLLDAMC